MATAAVVPDSVANASVVVYDTDPLTVDVLGKFLEDAGAVAPVLCSDADAMVRALRQRPHLLLARWPSADRPDARVTDAMHNAASDHQTALIVLIEGTDPEHRDTAVAGGAREFLPLPADPSELLVRCNAVLAARAYELRVQRIDPVTGLASMGGLLAWTDTQLRRLEPGSGRDWRNGDPAVEQAHPGAVVSLDPARTPPYLGTRQVHERDAGHDTQHDASTAGQPGRKRASGEHVFALSLLLEQMHQVSDGVGPDAEGAALAEAVRRIKSVADSVPAQHLLARSGASAFTLVLSGSLSVEAALDLSEALRDNLARPMVLHHTRVAISASVGLAASHEDGQSAEELIYAAGALAIEATRRGGNRVQSSAPANADLQIRQRTLGADVERAIYHGQLRVMHQPRMRLADRTACGFDTMIEWQHPTLGIQSTLEVVAAAERGGHIRTLGEWLLREVCTVAAALQSITPSAPTLYVRVAERHLQRPEFVSSIRAGVSAAHIGRGALGIAVPDTAVATWGEKLTALQSLGLRLTVDLTVSGGLPLHALRGLQPDNFRVDSRLCRDLSADSQDRRLMAGLAAFAENTGSRLIALGVTEPEQVEFFKNCGFDAYQGKPGARALTTELLMTAARGPKAPSITP
ncbi:MAG: EAL domain-containing protein [Pseudomonadota bacterium]